MLSEIVRCRGMGIVLALGILGCNRAGPDPVVPSLVPAAARIMESRTRHLMVEE